MSHIINKVTEQSKMSQKVTIAGCPHLLYPQCAFKDWLISDKPYILCVHVRAIRNGCVLMDKPARFESHHGGEGPAEDWRDKY